MFAFQGRLRSVQAKTVETLKDDDDDDDGDDDDDDGDDDDDDDADDDWCLMLGAWCLVMIVLLCL